MATVTAKVSELDYPKGYVKVIFTDRSNTVSDWLPMQSHEYEMPKVGDVVTCDFTNESRQVGFCKGRYWNDERKPIKQGEDIYHKQLLEEADILYDRAEQLLTITVKKFKLTANHIKIETILTEHEGDVKITGNVEHIGKYSVTGTVTINGDAQINGNLHVDGTITASGNILANTGGG